MAPTSRAYFAYSALLDPETFARRMREEGNASFELPEGQVGEAQDVDIVFNLHSPGWGGRIASLVAMPGRTVFGRLIHLGDADLQLVRRAEGGKPGDLVEMPVRVKVDGKPVEAIALATSPDRATTGGPVSEEYARALARGAEAAGLPRPYWERLKAEAAILARVQSVGRELNLG